MLVFTIIMIFILIVIFVLPKYKHKKVYRNASSGQKQQQYQNTSTTLLALTFHPKTETVHLFGHTVNAYFYTCEQTSYIPFAINTRSKPDFAETTPDKLSFSPHYHELDENQQAYYITWLAKGKPAIDDMGYVYLYYYGLEYRALVEKKDHKDILFEVIDLVAKFKKLR